MGQTKANEEDLNTRQGVGKSRLGVSVFALLVIFFGCAQEEPFEPVYRVPIGLEEIIDQFIFEASLRDRQIQIDNLIVQFDESIDVPYCGRCNSTSAEKDIQKVISLSPSLCWASELELEALIFHELGHCVLGRGHTSDLLPNGDPKSLMTPSGISLYAHCAPAGGGVDCSNMFKRDYYLTELFHEETPVPDWGQ